MQSNVDLKAALLAAGKATRLHPITLTRPLALLPIAGKPVLDHLLHELEEAGITDFVSVVGYMEDTVSTYTEKLRGTGKHISTASQTELLGTADAVATAARVANSNLLVLYVDSFVDSSAIKLGSEKFQRGDADVVILTCRVDDPSAYGLLEVDGDKIIRVIEKPPADSRVEGLVNTGCYFFKKGVAQRAGQTSIHRTRKEKELTSTIQELIDEGKHVLSCEIPKKSWMDLGKLWNLLDANEYLLSKSPHAIAGVVEPGATIRGPVSIGENSFVRAGAYLEGPIFIGRSSDIGPNCYIRGSASIGDNVRIGNAVEVKNSIVLNGAHIGHLSYIGDSIVGEQCNLGAGTITANLRLDGENVKVLVKGEVTDTGRRKLGAIIGDGVRTGVNVSLMPGVKLGPRSQINAHLKVERDVGQETFYRY